MTYEEFNEFFQRDPSVKEVARFLKEHNAEGVGKLIMQKTPAFVTWAVKHHSEVLETWDKVKEEQ